MYFNLRCWCPENTECLFLFETTLHRKYTCQKNSTKW